MKNQLKCALHSISYCGLWGQETLTLEAFIERAAILGYTGVEITAKRPHASLLDMTQKRRQRLRDLMQSSQVQTVIIAGYNDFCGGWETPDVPFGEMQVLAIAEMAKLARDLDCDKVRVFTGFEKPKLPYDQQWRWCVQGLKEAARRAADYDVTLCVQNHHDIAVQYEALFDLLSEIDEPNCRAGFDAWAPALHGDDLATAVKKMAPFIAHTTVADYVRRPRFRYAPTLVNYDRHADAIRAVPMGEGFIAYDEFFKALHEVEYSGWVAYEMCSPLRGGGSKENLDACARRFLEWMKDRSY